LFLLYYDDYIFHKVRGENTSQGIKNGTSKTRSHNHNPNHNLLVVRFRWTRRSTRFDTMACDRRDHYPVLGEPSSRSRMVRFHAEEIKLGESNRKRE
jgi:hypothetical protein